MTLFSEKISIFTAKISDDFLKSLTRFFEFSLSFTGFSVSFLYQIFRIFPMFNVVKTPLFTRFILSRASDNTTSQNIGGRMHGPSPTSNFGGTVPSVPDRSPPLVGTLTVLAQ